MINFENEIYLLEMELRKRQQAELDEFSQSIQNGAAAVVRVHYSPLILDLETKIQHLSAQGLYPEAKVLKRKIKVMKRAEKEKSNEEAR